MDLAQLGYPIAEICPTAIIVLGRHICVAVFLEERLEAKEFVVPYSKEYGTE
jgi:hypothetical protein